MNIENLLYAALILITAFAGYLVKSLTLSGAIATVLIGAFTAIGFGWKGLLILGLFFASSSFWSKYKKRQKDRVDEIIEKSGRRDWIQVFANGSTSAFFAFAYFLFPHDFFLAGFLVAIAAANSDTWASEIGVLSKQKPIFILTGKKADPGTSGAISPLGTVAAFGGAMVIAVFSVYLLRLPVDFWLFFIAVFGFIGNVLDTLLGSMIQVEYQCVKCGLKTEKTIHCQEKTIHIKGLVIMNNDMVNFLSITFAALFSIVFHIIIS
ncbi:DUF92 domain-containing protein [Peribacillus tepidiphilus]|uniref:DUF92 domain-containing protein n=1 Tax=Peribacillus tepidiphilus TaxID=2652445 RepID=UPI0035B53239